ncbi:YceI family protein [Deinococcus marmoris]|uniref:YceI family protein n=1 Tax=Deinococcus marmoris TaxID=249408 RepID=UPI00049771D1|nr:YceI family protein [Deinococcus marmoris]
MRHLFILPALLLASAALAAPVKYAVTDLDNVNVMTAENETDIENFTAITNKISGTVTFDAAAKMGSADLTVDGASIKTGVAARDGHMVSKDWFNFAANPTIRFKTTQVSWVSGDNYKVSGTLTMNGVTKPVSTTARVKLTPANDVTKGMKIPGDALAVSLKMNVLLSDYGVQHPAIKAGRVGNTLPISLKFIASQP